jgi:predicted metal-dependent enzyme (double-stranded beta helix superfamily)
MTSTDTSTTPDQLTLDALVASVRTALRPGMPDAEAADAVAECLRGHLPGAGVLTDEQRLGDPAKYVQHILHVEPDGAFSIVALVWRPGQTTPVHDHVSWCVVGVLHGTEYEEIFAVDDTSGEPRLRLVSDAVNATGEVCGFAPPGDIHRVRNTGADVAVSLHVYGANIAELGNSVRRTYDLPFA